jgi:hypothetical protein
MRTKTYLLMIMVMVLALGMACGGGGSSGSGTSSGGGTNATPNSSGGGSSSNSLVGSWVLVNSNYSGATQRLNFSSNGTGSWDSGSLAWTQKGNQFTATSDFFTASIAVNGNTLSWSDSNGVSATYQRT